MTRIAAKMPTMTSAIVTPFDVLLSSLLLDVSAVDPPMPGVGGAVGDAVGNVVTKA